jgi:purine-nucleoside phosphorylase
MENIYDKAQEAADYIRSKVEEIPSSAVQLGTGLGDAVTDIRVRIPYSEIPHFPQSTVQGHSGELQIAYLGDKSVLVLSGRFHYYEGYSLKEVSFPVRVLKALDIKQFIITNVTGGLQAEYKAGTLVFAHDHINLLPDNPLRGLKDDRLGIRFPDMKDAYSPRLLARAKEICSSLNIQYRSGVYVCLQGPSLETKAEYNYLHQIGADMVGMSSVPEVIVAKQCEIDTMMISCISNVCYPIELITETTVEEVIAVAQAASIKMKRILEGLIS